MIRWLKKLRQRRNQEIATAVYNELTAQRGWKKFLPPVVLRDAVYMLTEDGSIYKMKYDGLSEMEVIIQIKH